MRTRSILISVILSITPILPTTHSPHPNDLPRTEQATEKWITIFVHGTLGLRNTLSFKTLSTLFRENINGTRYKKKMTELRKDPNTYCHQVVQKLGLHKIDVTKPPQIAAQIFAQEYNAIQKQFYPDQTTIEYYTFGWSGLINPNERYNDARKFFKELQEAVEHVRKNYPNIKIRIVAYSHGANVALNLAEINAQSSQPANFIVNELIMIGTPVQRETDCFVADPFFEKVFNIYSRSDYVQQMDCFSNIRFFSSRRFRDNARCSMGKKLHQIEVKLAVEAKNDFKQPYSSKRTIDRSPGHIELWNFGWPGASKLYRHYFPLNPLPLALFIPALVKATEDHFPDTRNVVISVRPDNGTGTIKQRKHQKKTRISFVSPEELDKIKEKVRIFHKKCIGESKPEQL